MRSVRAAIDLPFVLVNTMSSILLSSHAADLRGSHLLIPRIHAFVLCTKDPPPSSGNFEM